MTGPYVKKGVLAGFEVWKLILVIIGGLSFLIFVVIILCGVSSRFKVPCNQGVPNPRNGSDDSSRPSWTHYGSNVDPRGLVDLAIFGELCVKMPRHLNRPF